MASVDISDAIRQQSFSSFYYLFFDDRSQRSNEELVAAVTKETRKRKQLIDLTRREDECGEESKESIVCWEYPKTNKTLKIGETNFSTDEPPALTLPEKVSTKLTLFDESWTAENSTLGSKKPRNIDGVTRLVANHERTSTQKTALGDRVWKIQKKLSKTDQSRYKLAIGTRAVRNYVLKFLSGDIVKEVESPGGAEFVVWDVDTKTQHTLVLAIWPSNNNVFIFKGGWRRNFVKRRNLKAGDEIGFYWDECYSRLKFSVLCRATPQ